MRSVHIILQPFLFLHQLISLSSMFPLYTTLPKILLILPLFIYILCFLAWVAEWKPWKENTCVEAENFNTFYTASLDSWILGNIKEKDTERSFSSIQHPICKGPSCIDQVVMICSMVPYTPIVNPHIYIPWFRVNTCKSSWMYVCVLDPPMSVFLSELDS